MQALQIPESKEVLQFLFNPELQSPFRTYNNHLPSSLRNIRKDKRSSTFALLSGDSTKLRIYLTIVNELALWSLPWFL